MNKYYKGLIIVLILLCISITCYSGICIYEKANIKVKPESKKVEQEIVVVKIIVPNEQQLITKTVDYTDYLVNKYELDYQYFDNINSIVKSKCAQYDLNYNEILALIGVESNYKQKAVSYKGKKYGNGLMQVSEIVLTEYNWKHNTRYTVNDLYNPEFNIEVGCWMYARNRDHYNVQDDLEHLMSAYNMGARGGLNPRYVSKIMEILEQK